MKLKILAVDFPIEGKGIENYTFYEAPSFSDYDAVIIDPQDIPDKWIENATLGNDGFLRTYTASDRGFGNSLLSFMYQRGRELRKLLEITKGIVVCILRKRAPKLYLHEYHGAREFGSIDMYSWLPHYYMEIIPQTGKQIRIVNRHYPFSQYLSALKDSLCFEAILEFSKKIYVIATNKVGDIVAGECMVGDGRLIFLPPLESLHPEKTGGVLIDCFRGALKWRVPTQKPEWLSAYSLHVDDEILSKIKELEDEISYKEKEKERLKSEHDRLEMLKGLLYEQGKYGLEPSVREAFRILGFNVLEPDQYDEEYDLFVKEEDLNIIGEIEGTESQIDIKKG